MHIVSLIAQPGKLDPALVDSLRNAFGGGDAVWLSPDEAAEFPINAIPEQFEDVRASVSEMADLNLLPADGRRKRMLIADMDSTMIEQECIDELAVMADVGTQVKDITARAMNGELDFEGALRERVGLLKGLPVNVIDEVISQRITLMPGGPVLLATMKAHGAYAALVSGGFTAFTTRIAATLGFDENRANTLDMSGGHLTGKVGDPILGRQAKVQALDEICDRLGLSPKDVLAVGDGANDIGMLTRAGLGVALHAKPSVQAQCAFRINHSDLTALLFLQGYSLNTFVRP